GGVREEEGAGPRPALLVRDLGGVGRAAGGGRERRGAVAGDARSHSRASLLDLVDPWTQFFRRVFRCGQPIYLDASSLWGRVDGSLFGERGAGQRGQFGPYSARAGPRR